MSTPKGVQELVIVLEACGGVPNKRGQLSKHGSDVATRVSGNKSKKGESHRFAGILPDVSWRRASYPGNV